MLFDEVKREILTQLNVVLEKTEDVVLEIPPDPKLGDFAFPTFRLCKFLRKSPQAISQEMIQKLSLNSNFTKKYEISAQGSYINFTVKKEILLKEVLDSILLSKDSLAEQTLASPQTIILEFSSPNVAKPFNIYHLRGTMIGHCLTNIFKARGYQTITFNHLGDWGTQYGTLALAYDKWGDDQELEKRGINYLVELYVRMNQEIKKDETLAKKAREYFSKLEKDDPKIKKYWEKFVALSLKEFKRIYDRLGVHFDHYLGESFYTDKMPAVEKILMTKKLLEESEGAMVVKLDAFGMPPCLVRKRDGSSLYATRDLAAASYRYEKFHFSKMIYIVGGEQKLHFSQIFKVLELMGYAWAKNCTHVEFGLYRFGSAKTGFEKMSTRKGHLVRMEEVLDQAVERVKQIMEKKSSEEAQAAEIIGVGAVIYNDLSTDRIHDVNFDLNSVLDFEGETGPYIQYAHTRCLGILRHSPQKLIEGIHLEKLTDLSCPQPGYENLYKAAKEKLSTIEEIDLIRTLAKFPLILDSVLEQYRPSQLATYLIDITKAFNAFYRAHKVLVDDETLARARLALVCATQRTLLKGLNLLGMKVPSRM